MIPKGLRDRFILLFVFCWLTLFHYESLRYFYLQPLFKETLPKFKFLFPPAGWIMFYQVESSEGRVEVYGENSEGRLELIDPHRIFENRWIGYDNIRRNVLVSTLNVKAARYFNAYLRRKFPEYSKFHVFYVNYPDVVHEPTKRIMQLAYEA